MTGAATSLRKDSEWATLAALCAGHSAAHEAVSEYKVGLVNAVATSCRKVHMSLSHRPLGLPATHTRRCF